MELQLTGDVAVVVGGARGLGLAIASAFLAEGARVAILDRDSGGPAEARRLEEASAVRCVGLVTDATDFDAVRAAADDLQREFGRCDHVVFAAAVGSGKLGFPFWELDPADWDRVLRVNLVGAANVAHAFAPRMAEAKRGTLLFLASVAGQIGSQTDPPYSASKAGLINFAQCAGQGPSSVRRAGQFALPGDGQDGVEPIGLRSLGRAAGPRAGADPVLRRVGRREGQGSGAAGTLADAGGRRRDGCLSRVKGGRQRHRADDQRRRRIRDALVKPAARSRSASGACGLRWRCCADGRRARRLVLPCVRVRHAAYPVVRGSPPRGPRRNPGGRASRRPQVPPARECRRPRC